MLATVRKLTLWCSRMWHSYILVSTRRHTDTFRSYIGLFKCGMKAERLSILSWREPENLWESVVPLSGIQTLYFLGSCQIVFFVVYYRRCQNLRLIYRRSLNNPAKLRDYVPHDKGMKIFYINMGPGMLPFWVRALYPRCLGEHTMAAELWLSHSQHLSAEEKPHEIVPSRDQQQFSIKISAGIFGGCLLGPHVLPARLTGQNYIAFMENHLPVF